MNNVQLMGRLAQDIEVIYTNKGTCVAHLTLAIDRPLTKEQQTEGQQKADFIPCVAFDKIAEQLGNTVSKGKRLLISNGRLYMNKYKDQEGKNRTHAEVRIYGFEYVEYKNPFGTEVELDEEIKF